MKGNPDIVDNWSILDVELAPNPRIKVAEITNELISLNLNETLSLKPVYETLMEYCKGNFWENWLDEFKKFNDNMNKIEKCDFRIFLGKTLEHDESGNWIKVLSAGEIDLWIIQSKWIDPNYILTFRATNLSAPDKPERFWHNSIQELIYKFHEVRNAEHIYISTLAYVFETWWWCVQDINYGDWLSPFQIQEVNFDKKWLIWIFKRYHQKYLS